MIRLLAAVSLTLGLLLASFGPFLGPLTTAPAATPASWMCAGAGPFDADGNRVGADPLSDPVPVVTGLDAQNAIGSESRVGKMTVTVLSWHPADYRACSLVN